MPITRIVLTCAATLGVVSSLCPLVSPANAYSGEVFTVCRLNPNGDNFLALRQCGSSSCEMTGKLGPGTFLLTFEPYDENGWRHITVMKNIDDMSNSGPSGWVYSKYICQVDLSN